MTKSSFRFSPLNSGSETNTFRTVVRENQLSDEKFAITLTGVGHACFIDFFEYFSSPDLSRDAMIEQLVTQSKYKANSCARRTDFALKIIQAGLSCRALEAVMHSRALSVSPKIKARAEQLLNALAP